MEWSYMLRQHYIEPMKTVDEAGWWSEAICYDSTTWTYEDSDEAGWWSEAICYDSTTWTYEDSGWSRMMEWSYMLRQHYMNLWRQWMKQDDGVKLYATTALHEPMKTVDEAGWWSDAICYDSTTWTYEDSGWSRMMEWSYMLRQHYMNLWRQWMKQDDGVKLYATTALHEPMKTVDEAGWWSEAICYDSTTWTYEDSGWSRMMEWSYMLRQYYMNLWRQWMKQDDGVKLYATTALHEPMKTVGEARWWSEAICYDSTTWTCNLLCIAVCSTLMFCYLMCCDDTAWSSVICRTSQTSFIINF